MATKTKGLRIATPCATVEQFIAAFHRFCEESSFFISTLSLRPIGIETAFSVDLSDGQSMLRGFGVVLDAWPTAANRFGRPGVRIGVHELTTDTKGVFEQLLIARAIAQSEPAIQRNSTRQLWALKLPEIPTTPPILDPRSVESAPIAEDNAPATVPNLVPPVIAEPRMTKARMIATPRSIPIIKPIEPAPPRARAAAATPAVVPTIVKASTPAPVPSAKPMVSVVAPTVAAPMAPVVARAPVPEQIDQEPSVPTIVKPTRSPAEHMDDEPIVEAAPSPLERIDDDVTVIPEGESIVQPVTPSLVPALFASPIAPIATPVVPVDAPLRVVAPPRTSRWIVAICGVFAVGVAVGLVVGMRVEQSRAPEQPRAPSLATSVPPPITTDARSAALPIDAASLATTGSSDAAIATTAQPVPVDAPPADSGDAAPAVVTAEPAPTPPRSKPHISRPPRQPPRPYVRPKPKPPAVHANCEGLSCI